MSKRVLVAMSGGVDSSTTALLLQREGYICDGAMLDLLPPSKKTSESGQAESLSDNARDARAVAEKLGMKFYLFEERDLFQRQVIDRFMAEYQAGRTPNPCIDCNRCLKFGSLLDKALEMGYDYLATGHYARIQQDPKTGEYRLFKARDPKKDQSYVLYQLTQHQLSHLLFPAGEFTKDQIRETAEKGNLINAKKQDSQDICFIPDGDYAGFLQAQGMELRPGNFVDKEGRVLGQHRGLPCYTTGQGRGLGVAAGHRIYVISKDGDRNEILLGENEDLYQKELAADHFNWISGLVPQEPFQCTGKTRYSQREAACRVIPGGLSQEGGYRVRVIFEEPQRAITAGQAVVVYQGDQVLGGGTIL